MHPRLAEIIEHLQTTHADHVGDLPDVIRECGEAGFAPIFIIAGLHHFFEIPHGEAKRLVVSHFYRDESLPELDQFHSELESSLLPDEPK